MEVVGQSKALKGSRNSDGIIIKDEYANAGALLDFDFSPNIKTRSAKTGAWRAHDLMGGDQNLATPLQLLEGQLARVINAHDGLKRAENCKKYNESHSVEVLTPHPKNGEGKN